ncbi:MAG: Antitoxin [uncultured Thiotrichaceae bacterium]|uniref:Antitoxin n=1 Tax=uncultured Thiotrichaceae bacterium TaxID=298394 RepID=A0A6S6T962_9GAMM|nr:MAG: Antitoxin [uncultured Thiotrichaceae bacterium]
MQQLNIYETKTRLSQLVEEASKGSTFIIAKAGKPLAKLVPLDENMGSRFRFGTMQGKIKVADDFDAPLPDDVLDLFEAD